MNTLKYIIIGVIALVMTSCSGVLESEKIVEQSEDKRLQIEVQGKRNGSLEPFVVEMLAQKEGLEPMVAKMEIYHDDITRDNVKFDWKSNNHCIISVSHRDGKVETIPIRFLGIE